MEQGGSAEVELEAGKSIRLTTDEQYYEKCTGDILYVDYKNIVQVMEIEGRIFIDDGLISVIVKDKGMCGFSLYYISGIVGKNFILVDFINV